METPPRQFEAFHDARFESYPLYVFETYTERLRGSPAYPLCDPIFSAFQWLIKKHYIIFYGMQFVNLDNGERDYLCIQFSVTYMFQNKRLFVPLILRVYPYNFRNSPPSVKLFTNNEYKRNRNAHFIDEFNCIYTPFMRRWEQDSEFEGGIQGLILDLRKVFSSINPYEDPSIANLSIDPNRVRKGDIIVNAQNSTIFKGVLDGTIPIAIKEWTVFPEVEYRFDREVRINMSMDHPNIIKTYGYYKQNIVHFLVMDLADSDLSQFLKREYPMKIRKEIILTMAKVLVYTLQQGIVHHDLKPENFLMKDGILKLADFGLSNVVDSVDFLRDTYNHGNILHQSLETRKLRFAKGMAKYKEEEKLAIYTAEDVYALGILIMEVLVGPRSVLNYVTYLNHYTDDSCLYTVKIPTSFINGRPSPLAELNRDPEICGIINDCLKGFKERPKINEVYDRISSWCEADTPQIKYSF